MAEAYFYHLTRRSLEDTLAMLAGKSLQAGWRVAVRGADAARLDWLDEKLWLMGEESFLPHGRAGGPHDALQPILLTDGAAANKAEYLMSIDGAEVAPEEVAGHARVCVIFDGNDDVALNRARQQWKALTDSGVRAQYWSEESGRWEKKAER
ncbi:MAG: DNA polymerase III subunit chi [Rhodobacteraceae bacterium]|nr:DNA polymerase III subunit chi [Paracoccaceae bacterium]